MLIKFFSEKCIDIPLPLSGTGSDCCEIFFSKVGGMIQNERSYTGADLLETTNALNRVAEFQALGELLFPATHLKQENIWHVLEKKAGPDGLEITCDLGNYSTVDNSDKIIYALEEGMREAQEMCLKVGICCKEKGADTWWTVPWKHEDYFDKNYFQQLDSIECEDETDRADLEHENDVVAGSAEENVEEITAMMELRHTFDAMVDETEQPKQERVERFVKIDNKEVYKATLISQLNGNPWLSKDRLTKVKNHVLQIDEKNKQINAATALGIGSDCAVFFEEEARVEAAKQKACHVKAKQKSLKAIWYLGRILSIRKKVGRCWKESREAIDLSSRPSYLVELNLAWYNEHNSGKRNWYTFDLSDSDMISLDSVIALANLTYKPKTGTYVLDDHDRLQFERFVADQSKGYFKLVLFIV